MQKAFGLVAFLILNFSICIAAPKEKIVVSQDGTGDFTTITEAINSLPRENFERVTIYINEGIYNEKIRIEQCNVSLIGADREKAIIQFSQYKNDWQNKRDYIGPAVINLDNNDIIIKNLTVKNSYPKLGKTAYAIYAKGTRNIFDNCNLIGNGANTVSLINYEEGMYYLRNCRIEGAVDFMRAFGSCYLTECEFFQKEAIASIWHGAISNKNEKMIVNNCRFDGTEHYFIGRHHYDAQFFILNCQFSEKLANKPLYKKEYPKNRSKEKAYLWGDRYYYFNCQTEGEKYTWLNDNLSSHPSKIAEQDLSAKWCFNQQWDPETELAPQLIKITKKADIYSFHFNEAVAKKGELTLKTSQGQVLNYYKGSGRHILQFSCEKSDKIKGSIHQLKVSKGSISATQASINERLISEVLNLQK